jgi:hypothetical protein
MQKNDSSIPQSSSIDMSDLQVGDLIFFVNHYYKSGATVDTPKEERHDPNWDPYVDHVAMYAGKDKHDNYQLVHSIAPTEESKYDLTKSAGMSLTAFKPLLNQTEGDVTYDVVFYVVRFANHDIASKAYENMLKWIRLRVPYDEKRLEEKLEKEKDQSTEDFLRDAVNSYETNGIFRAMKYAVRNQLEMPLTRPRIEEEKGLTCSMVVSLAFQIAELDKYVNISGINKKIEFWVSDKYGKRPNKIDEKYDQYLTGLHVTGKSASLFDFKARKNCYCSHFFWNENFSETFRHSSFRFDSKIIGAAGIYAYILRNQGDSEWNVLGIVEPPKPKITKETKGAHKLEVAQHKVSSEYNHSQLPLPVMTTTPERFIKSKIPVSENRYRNLASEKNPTTVVSTEFRCPKEPKPAIKKLQEKIESMFENSNVIFSPEKKQDKEFLGQTNAGVF